MSESHAKIFYSYCHTLFDYGPKSVYFLKQRNLLHKQAQPTFGNMVMWKNQKGTGDWNE